jgi:7-cyano-7-deazaguanine synthase
VDSDTGELRQPERTGPTASGLRLPKPERFPYNVGVLHSPPGEVVGNVIAGKLHGSSFPAVTQLLVRDRVVDVTQSRAVVLLSGGLDSATVLAIARHEGFEPYALSFRYGQRHSVELAAAERVAAALGAVRHVVADIDLRVFGGSALTDDKIDVPHHDRVDELDDEIPVTYVPARNTIFLSFALAWAETIGAADIFIGVNALDYSGYPDCRPEYIAAFEKMADLATKAGVEGEQRLKIHTPLIELTKADTIRLGLKLGVDYSLTHSCYDPVAGRACGTCDSCLLRGRGFAELGLTDPALALAE